MRIKNLLIPAIVSVAAPLASGCDGSEDKGNGGQAAAPATTTTQSTQPPTTTQSTQPPAASRTLTVGMTEFAFQPKDAVAKRGKVTIAARNDGATIHELVVLKTATDPGALPKKGGEVDERTSVGEIADVKPGATKRVSLQLAPGKYAMVCALPGHYEGGMYGSLTVR